MLYDAEDWSFRYGTATVTFTSGSQIVSDLPSDFHAVVALYDVNGSPLHGVADARTFFDNNNTALVTGTGTPSVYTVLDGQIYTDVLGDGTSGQMIYEKNAPTLENDSDTTGLPAGYDLALVHGGKAEMFKLQIVPDLAVSFDQDFTAGINALARNYLREVRETGQQWGAYRPGC